MFRILYDSAKVCIEFRKRTDWQCLVCRCMREKNSEQMSKKRWGDLFMPRLGSLVLASATRLNHSFQGNGSL